MLKSYVNASNVAILVLLVPVITYWLTSSRFRLKLRRGAGTAPTVPYWLPFIANTPTFAASWHTFALAFLAYSGKNAPIRFKGIGFDYVLISGPDIIRKVLSTANKFDWNKVTPPIVGRLFNLPPAVVKIAQEDDSGVGVKPYAGSNIPENRRIHRQNHVFNDDAFSKASMDEVISRFTNRLQTACTDFNIGDDWRELDDLYTFVRDLMFSSSIYAFFGPEMLKLTPELASDFWSFNDSIGFLAMGLPNWIKPQGAHSRGKCLDAVKRWRRHAENVEVIDRKNEAWDSTWGIGALKRKFEESDPGDEMSSEDAKAASDLGFLWALAANIIPATFWYLFEVLSIDGLCERARKEVHGTFRIDVAALFQNPLLQSIHAEVLRLQVSALLTRNVKQTHNLGDWVLPQDQLIFISSHAEHRNQQWNDVDNNNVHHGPTEFWPERFLVKEEGAERFSMGGKQAKWIPYGLGEHMCPGRHVAKKELMICFAVLVSTFDLELLTPRGWRPGDNVERYGLGTQHPKLKVPFRIRERPSKLTQ